MSQDDVGFMVGDNDGPDPEAYKIHMRTVNPGDGSTRHGDFVGSNSHTGRTKIEQPKWHPKKPDAGDNAFRNDDWMGSGKSAGRRSWKVKSKSTTSAVASPEPHSDDHVETTGGETIRRWKPPAKDAAFSPPWGTSPPKPSTAKRFSHEVTSSSVNKPPLSPGSDKPARRATTVHSWKPTSPSGVSKEPVHPPELALEDLQIGKGSHRVKDAIAAFNSSSNSLNASSFHAPDTHSPKHHVNRLHDSVPFSVHLAREEQTKKEEPEAVAAAAASADKPPTKDMNDSSEIEIQSDTEGDFTAPEPEPVVEAAAPATAVGVMIHDDDDGKPNPEEYKIHMRTVHQRDDNLRHDDFVGSYSNTGRVKLEKKGWQPTKPDAGDNAFRNDDWMGSGKTARRSWKVRDHHHHHTEQEEPKVEPVVEKPVMEKPVVETPVVEKVVEAKPASVDMDESTEIEIQSDTEGDITAPKPEPVVEAAPAAAVGVMIHDDDDDGKPNPEEYKIHMRTVHQGDDNLRHDDFVGSYSNTGRVKLEKKGWQPTKPEAGDNAFRNDDWMGSGKTARRSWKVRDHHHHTEQEEPEAEPVVEKPVVEKVVEAKPPTVDMDESTEVEIQSDTEGETAPESEEQPEPEPVVEKEVATPEPVAEAAPAPVPPAPTQTSAESPAVSVGVMIDDDDGKPNPEEYKIHMRTVHQGDDNLRHDDFVGSYSNTGRVKLEKKGWQPAKPEAGDNAFRNDDWMGSGKKTRKSWKVKS